MAHISQVEANAWLEPTKLALDSVDVSLEAQVSDIILSQLDAVFDITGWLDESNTPALVKTVIAMEYVAWTYDKFYSDDAESNAYAALLRQRVQQVMSGILSGQMTLPEVDPNPAISNAQPSFFPNDQSSANLPTTANPSDGGPAFLMGTVF